MTPDYDELVKWLRHRAHYTARLAKIKTEETYEWRSADVIEQQAGLLSARDQQIKVQAEKITMFMRELAACEGALRNSGNMVRDLNDEVLRLRAVLEEIARFPAHETVPNQYVASGWKWITNAKTIDIACEALGLCRECRGTLVPHGRGCSICGASTEA